MIIKEMMQRNHQTNEDSDKTFLQWNIRIYKKNPSVTLHLILKVFSMLLEKGKEVHPLLPHLFNTILNVTATAIREKKKKERKAGKSKRKN